MAYWSCFFSLVFIIMKLKIAAVISILIYIILVILLDYNTVLFGYLCAIDFALIFILLAIIFTNKPS